MAYLFENYDFGGNQTLPLPTEVADHIFIGLLGGVGTCIAATIVLLIYLLSSRRKYEEVGELPEVLAYKEDLEDYYRHRPASSEEEFKRDMAERYAHAAETNRTNNIADLARIKWAALLCGIAGGMLLITTVVYAGNALGQKTHNISKQKAMADPRDEDHTDTGGSERPTPPPNRETRDGDGPSKTKTVNRDTNSGEE